MECFTAHERTCFELKLLVGCADRATARKPRFSNIAPCSLRRSPAIAMAALEPLLHSCLRKSLLGNFRFTSEDCTPHAPTEQGLA